MLINIFANYLVTKLLKAPTPFLKAHPRLHFKTIEMSQGKTKTILKHVSPGMLDNRYHRLVSTCEALKVFSFPAVDRIGDPSMWKIVHSSPRVSGPFSHASAP